MKKKPPHVLIVNQYFPPDTSATAKMVYNLSLKLAEDYRVTVLCGRPSYNPAERHSFYIFKVFNMGSDLKVLRVGSTSCSRIRMKGRIINYLSYLFMASIIGPGLKPDVVVSMTDPPLAFLLGILISFFTRKPFVYNIRDFHPDMALKAGIIRDSFLVKLWDKLHRWGLKKADIIVVLGEDMKMRAIAKGVNSKKIAVVRDGTYLKSSNSYPPPDPQLIKSLRAGFPFVVGYAGNFGFAGVWETVVEAIKALKGEDSIGFIFVGDGPEKPRIVEMLRDCSNVKFFPFQPEQDLLSVLNAPDVHLITLKRGLEGLVVPSKLYPILTVGKPVIAVAPEESDVAKIITEHQCGLVADPDNPEELVKAVRYLVSNPEILKDFGSRAEASSGWFDVGVTFQEFKKVISSVLK